MKNLIATVIFSCLLLGCGMKKREIKNIEFNPVFTNYISAFTSGQVPKKNTVKVRFTDYLVHPEVVGMVEERKLFAFYPAIEGKAIWVDRKTLEFTPTKFLESGQVYDAELNLAALYDTVPAALARFSFQFHTKEQMFYTGIPELKPMDENGVQWYKLEGTLKTNEWEENERVEKVVAANGKIRWRHDKEGLLHTFILDSIERKAEAYKLKISFNGAPVKSSQKLEQEIEVPALNDFKIISSETFHEPEQFVKLRFSDPLLQNQDLTGLIHNPYTQYTFIIEKNSVLAYPTSKLKGETKVFIEPGIKNALGHKSKYADTLHLDFEETAPQVRLVGNQNGTIVPNSNGIPFPFEAINLIAVDVRIIKIYESNVLEFLQFNRMDGSSYINYVGKNILEQRVMLNTDPKINLGKWNRHSLDLSKLIETEPGAIYRVSIRFRKDYSLYGCRVETKPPSDAKAGKESGKLWDYFNYSYWDSENYHNPCADFYYKAQNGITKNILASDLGMIAKRGTDGKVFIAVSGLKTTEPYANIPVELYDKQKKVMKTVLTDENGFAWAKLDEAPVIAVAKNGRQRGYLPMDYNSLSLSKFEVDGNMYDKGLKGFIYTERGVWRPGDSIFVSFILEDKQRVLPVNHPVLFELINPKGQQVERRVLKESVNGFYHFPTATALNAPTGNYLARVSVGGATFEKTIKVETIVPNRLKLQFDLAKDAISFDDKIIGKLHVKWLHGAPSGGMKADVNVLLKKAANPFPQYKGYVFSDPLYSSVFESKNIFEGKLDKDGNAEIKNNFGVTGAVPGVLQADVFCKVFEPGGNFSTDNFSLTYHPFNKYLGLKIPQTTYNVLDVNDEQQFELLSIDKDGKLIEEEILLELYQLQYNWWYAYENDLSSYNGRYHQEPLETVRLKTKDGKAVWKKKFDVSGSYLLRACYGDGHCTGTTVEVWEAGWYSRKKDDLSGTSMLNITAGKEKYAVGEKAQIEIPFAIQGKALVTIENGSGIIKAEWIKANTGKTKYTFAITPEMAPNVYVSVMLVQPHAQTANDLPIRMYGIVPVMVENPQSHLKPVLLMPDELKPEEKVVIKVKEEKGRKMAYTIAMVDEGLLDLTRFKTPNPWRYFFAKQALEVTTWDMYDNVMSNHTSKIKKLLSIGGDSGESEPGQGSKVQRFKPMVKYLGPFYLEAGQTASHSIMMPKYVGSVRTMVIAGDEGAYGAAEKTTAVKKPLMVLATMPRVLGPNEEVVLPLSVFADDKIKEASVTVETNELLELQGPSDKKVYFPKAGEETVTFAVKVKEGIGVAKLTVKAFSGKETATYDVELEVRAPNPVVSKAKETVLKAGTSETIAYTATGMKGTNKGLVEISSYPSLNLENRLRYLIQYPHGCLEQTTSSVFPQLALNDIMNLSPKEQKEVQSHINFAIHKLRNFQGPDGGMAYWPGASGYNEWGTNYSGHFLIEAQKRGFNIPASLMERLISFQKKKANAWVYNNGHNDELIQAYRLYLLALAGKPEFGPMNRLKEMAGLSETSLWYLAGAYHLAGQRGVAEGIVKNLSTEPKPYKELSHTFGSDIRDRGIILDIISQMPIKEKGAELAKRVTADVRSENWLSTQETAYCLLGISRYYGKSLASPINLEYRINGGEWKQLSGTKAVYQAQLDFKNGPNGKLEVRNIGTAQVYLNTVVSGIPASDKEQPMAKNLELKVNYMDMAGKPIQVDELEQGLDFVAEIRVKNTGNYEEINELALSYLFPSGWQVHNPRMGGEQFALKASRPTFMDVRDDRVFYYFDLKSHYYNRYRDYSDDEEESYDEPGNEKVFRIALNASFLGRFYLPSTACEAMYDNEIKAVSKGKWVRVSPSNLPKGEAMAMPGKAK